MLLNRFVGVAVGAAVVSSASAGLLTMDILGGQAGDTVVIDNDSWDLNPAVNAIEVNPLKLMAKYEELVDGTSFRAYSVQGTPGTLGQVKGELSFQASSNLPRVGTVGQYQYTAFIVRTYQTDFSMLDEAITVSNGSRGDFRYAPLGEVVTFGGGLNLNNTGPATSQGEAFSDHRFSTADPASFSAYSDWQRNLNSPFAIETLCEVTLHNNTFVHSESVTAAAVPEPASMAVLGLSVAAVLRRRKK